MSHPVGTHSLDDNTLAYIFSCVDLSDSLKLAPVCRRWKDVVEDQQVRVHVSLFHASAWPPG